MMGENDVFVDRPPGLSVITVTVKIRLPRPRKIWTGSHDTTQKIFSLVSYCACAENLFSTVVTVQSF